MNQQFGPLLYTISIWALPAIIAITFHEAAHGFVALRFGDDTALRLGHTAWTRMRHSGCYCFAMHKLRKDKREHYLNSPDSENGRYGKPSCDWPDQSAPMRGFEPRCVEFEPVSPTAGLKPANKRL
jgi:hypothetical protein